MITNEERREVAARLRKEAEQYAVGFDTLKLIEYIGIDVDNEPFFDGWHKYPELITFETWNRLADLIEPEPEHTCKNNDGFCSECGQELAGYTKKISVDDEQNITITFAVRPYCCRCGAKVQS